MDILIAILGFVVVTAITPGPNNLLLAAASMRFGPRSTIPHLLGIVVGFGCILMVCALGISVLLKEHSWILDVMRVGASLYLLYLAFTIIGLRLDADLSLGINAGEGSDKEPAGARPMTVGQSILFQCLNPKAWVMSTAGISLATSMHLQPLQAAALLLLCFVSVGLACNSVWIFLGAAIRRYLHREKVQLMVNTVLFILTVATVGMFWWL